MILIKTNTFSICSKIFSVRKEHNLKYEEFVLPNDIDDNHGFHMSCYHKFTTLPKTQRENNNEISNQHDQTTRTMRSNLTLQATSSRTAIFPKVCFLCLVKN